MNEEIFKKLIAHAKKDPTFFHALVFEPEKVLDSLDYLSKKERGSIVGKDVDELFAHLVDVQYCGNTCSSSCGNTCNKSCGYTTNRHLKEVSEEGVAYFSRFNETLEGCGNTCSSSCGNTCNKSCGYTTNLQNNETIYEAVNARAGCGNTCSSSCGNTCNKSCGYTTNKTPGSGNFCF